MKNRHISGAELMLQTWFRIPGLKAFVVKHKAGHVPGDVDKLKKALAKFQKADSETNLHGVIDALEEALGISMELENEFEDIGEEGQVDMYKVTHMIEKVHGEVDKIHKASTSEKNRAELFKFLHEFDELVDQIIPAYRKSVELLRREVAGRVSATEIYQVQAYLLQGIYMRKAIRLMRKDVKKSNQATKKLISELHDLVKSKDPKKEVKIVAKLKTDLKKFGEAAKKAATDEYNLIRLTEFHRHAFKDNLDKILPAVAGLAKDGFPEKYVTHFRADAQKVSDQYNTAIDSEYAKSRALLAKVRKSDRSVAHGATSGAGAAN